MKTKLKAWDVVVIEKVPKRNPNFCQLAIIINVDDFDVCFLEFKTKELNTILKGYCPAFVLTKIGVL